MDSGVPSLAPHLGSEKNESSRKLLSFPNITGFFDLLDETRALRTPALCIFSWGQYHRVGKSPIIFGQPPRKFGKKYCSGWWFLTLPLKNMHVKLDPQVKVKLNDVCNHHLDSVITGCSPSKWPYFMAHKWGVILTTYKSWDDPPSIPMSLHDSYSPKSVVQKLDYCIQSPKFKIDTQNDGFGKGGLL